MGRTPDQYAEDAAFEEEVQRVARVIFTPRQPYQGSTMIAGRERDGVFVGDDMVVAIEATTGRTVEKAQKDGAKLKPLVEALAKQYRFKGVKGFFITRDEPTAAQRDAIKALNSSAITACSFAQFRGQLIDSRDYLDSRAMYPFGSARNPHTGSSTDLEDYVQLGFSASSGGVGSKVQSTRDIVERMKDGNTIILLGDFGAGKSMTLREVHQRLATAHFKDPLAPFPMTLNLRDHQGQQDPDEAIRRHASRLGFDAASKLVRAWRAGQVHILLDGFDEIAASGWRGRTPNLKEIRRGSVELVRRFAEETPTNVGVIVSGRRHFFDSESEMVGSLGLRTRNAELLYTDDFTEGQVKSYLQSHAWTGQLPDWLPSHPLLLGHLASAGALKGLAEEGAVDPAAGWDYLLDTICERDARIEHGLDGSAIRRILERMASIARARGGGSGPIYPADLSDAFESVAGYPPNEGSYQILQRLPGLGIQDAADGSRLFIDASLLDAARAGDVVRYAIGQDESLENIGPTAVSQGILGVRVAAIQAARAGMTAAQANVAAKRIQSKDGGDALAFDLVRIGVELGTTTPDALTFTGLEIERFAFDDSEFDLGALTLRECVIATLDLTEYDGESQIPHFENCLFGTVLGAGSVGALPAGRFSDCDYEAFDPSSKTTRGILGMPGLKPKQKVLLTILKKVYLQSGTGRKEGALSRGLSPEMQSSVPEAIDRLLSGGVLLETRSRGAKIYLPVRGQRARVHALLESPVASHDSLLADI